MAGQNSRAKASKQKPCPLHEVVAERLYTVSDENFKPEYLSGITTVIDMSGKMGIIPSPEKYLRVVWSTEDNVDEGQFEGVVRLVSSSMKGRKQKVLLVGHQDTVDTVATCVMREFIGCDPQVALDVMRSYRPNCMTKSELIETVFKYKPS